MVKRIGYSRVQTGILQLQVIKKDRECLNLNDIILGLGLLGSLERTSYLTRPRIRVGRLRARIEYTVPECNKNILARSSTTYVLARSTFSRCTRTSRSMYIMY